MRMEIEREEEERQSAWIRINCLPSTFTDGQALEGKRKYTSVWVNEDGRWKEVHLHISMIGEK